MAGSMSSSHTDAVRTGATGRIEMANLDKVLPWNQPRRNARIPSRTAIVILGDQARLAVGAEQLHHDISLPTGLNDMAALSGHPKCAEVLLPWLTDCR